MRVEVLSKMTATVLRPLPSAAKGWTLYGRGLHPDGEVEDLGLLGRGEVRVLEEVAGGHMQAVTGRPLRSGGGRAARRGSGRPVGSVRISGGASRMVRGPGLLTMNPASSPAATTAGATSASRSKPISRPSPRTSVTPSTPARPVRRCSPTLSDVVEDAAGFPARAGWPGRPRWPPGCRRMSCRAGRRTAARTLRGRR